jgi:prepilin-type N-terminal cleavage/methylation domain-containing protein
MKGWAAGETGGWRGRGGFTVMELVVVIVIIALLAAITIPSFSVFRRRNQLATCALNLKSIGAAMGMYRDDYMGFPLDRTELAGKMYKDEDIKGPGLFYLYYLYRNPENPQLNKRVGELYTDSDGNGKWDPGEPYTDANGNGKWDAYLWWSNVGADYGIRRIEILHCPANPVARPVFRTPASGLPDPTLAGYNNYDCYYRRDWGSAVTWPEQDNRKLTTPFPADETVITWCPYHRGAPSSPPQPPDLLPQPGQVGRGDMDLVLFADGVVERVLMGPKDSPDFSPDVGPPARAWDTEDYKARHIF